MKRIERLLRAHAANLVAGACAVGGFAPFGYWPLPILSLAVLFAGLARANSRSAGFASGFAWGIGFFLAGVSWVYVSLHVYGGMGVVPAGLATFLFCAFLALFPAAVGAAVAGVRRRTLRWLLALPLAWAAGEWIRGWIFTGFPWLVSGYSQVPASPLAGFAPIFGVYGVSYLLALVAALAGWSVLGHETRRARIAALAAILALGLAGEGLRGVDWTSPEGAPTTVSLLQGNVPQDMKWRPEGARDALALYARLAAASPARLVLLPETALPVFESDLPDFYRDGLVGLGRAHGGDVLAGLPTGAREGAYYNSAVSFGEAPTQRYHKVHLVPFGEYLPQKALWGWVLDVLRIPLSDFARGSADQPPLAIGGQRVAVNICYEDGFGMEILRPLPEASVLANLSNLAWFGDSLAPWQHAQMSQMRALETGRMVLRATNTGLTAIIDTKGRIVASLPPFERGALGGAIQGYTGSTPYVRWGDAPVLSAWALLTALLLFRRKRAR